MKKLISDTCEFVGRGGLCFPEFSEHKCLKCICQKRTNSDKKKKDEPRN